MGFPKPLEKFGRGYATVGNMIEGNRPMFVQKNFLTIDRFLFVGDVLPENADVPPTLSRNPGYATVFGLRAFALDRCRIRPILIYLNLAYSVLMFVLV